MSDKTNLSKSQPKLLIVEDDPGLQAQLKWAFEDFEVVVVGDRAAALAALRTEEPAVVTLDLGLPPDPDGTSEGFAVLDEIMALKPDTKVIVATGHGARESALTAIAKGAYDFYQKPVDIEKLGLIVRRALQLHRIEQENRSLAAKAGTENRVLGSLITSAPEMVRVARTIERVANTNVSVMLLGASGTGKELLARGLHEASDRRDGAFVAINCAAIPENLLESELFGHEKGAFTGAVKTTEGKIEQAAGGTLFLDEVGDIPLQLQVKLLRFLQERVIERIGSRTSIAVDTRIVCATHQDLETMIADGRFREDLFYRLAEIVVKIPSLAERPGDAALLAKTFMARFAKEMNPQIKGFAPDALAAIDAWPWPGNVRELENRVKRAVIMSDTKLIGAVDLDLPAPDQEEGPRMLNLKSAREQADRKAIRHALARSEGNISGTARLLGISRPTLYDLLKQMTFTPERGFKLAVVAVCTAAALIGTSLLAASSQAAGFIASAQAALGRGDGIAAEADLQRALDAGVGRADVAAAMGDALLQQGANDKAREWLAPGQFADGQQSYGWRMLGRLERGEGNLPAAGKAYDRALQFAPNDGELWVDIGRLRYAGGEQLQAVEAADHALAAAPATPRTLEFRGQLIRDQYGLSAALPWFEAGLRQQPDDLALLGEYAATLGELGRAKEMLKATRRMLSLDPGNARALYLQAVLAARAGKMDLARALLGRIGDRMAGVPAAMLLRGALELEAGNPNLAIDVLDRLARMQPANGPARLLLARAAVVAGDRGQLFSAYPDATAGSPYLLTLQARAQEDAGRRDLAAPLLTRAAAPGIEPGPIGERQDVGNLAADWAETPGRIGAGVPFVRKLVVTGNLVLAGEIAEKLRQANPGSADVQAIAGDVQLLQHNPAGAIERYRIAAKVRVTSDLVGRMALALDRLGALDRSGQSAIADQLVEAQLAASPTDYRLNRLAATRAARRGDWPRSRALLEYLTQAMPRDPGLLDELVQARLRTGDKPAAEQAAGAAYALRRGSAAATRGYAAVASGNSASLLNAKAGRFDSR